MEPTDTLQLRNDLVAVMRQGRRFIEQLDDELYAAGRPELQLASIGDHYRHHLDYIEVFLRDLGDGTVDYDARGRDEAVATKRQRAVETTQRLEQRLRELNQSQLDAQLQVVQRNRPDEEERSAVATTAAREFAFLISHSVHHYAIIAIAARANGVQPPAEFGVMPSTLRHRRSRHAAAGE